MWYDSNYHNSVAGALFFILSSEVSLTGDPVSIGSMFPVSENSSRWYSDNDYWAMIPGLCWKSSL